MKIALILFGLLVAGSLLVAVVETIVLELRRSRMAREEATRREEEMRKAEKGGAA